MAVGSGINRAGKKTIFPNEPTGRADPEKCRRYVTRWHLRTYVTRPPVYGLFGTTVRQRTNPPSWVCRIARRSGSHRKVRHAQGVALHISTGGQPAVISPPPEAMGHPAGWSAISGQVSAISI